MKEYGFTFKQRVLQEVEGTVVARNKKEAERKIRRWAEEGIDEDIELDDWSNLEVGEIKDLELEELS